MTPEDFDVEAWLTDAHLPEDSVDVFKRGDVIAELSELERKIDAERAAGSKEQTSADKSRLAALEKKHQELVDTFGESALTIYVKALSPAEQKALREDLGEGATQSDLQYATLLASITAVKQYGKNRQPVKMTRKLLQGMENAIGAVQVRQLVFAQNQVQNSLPVVDADFLHRHSGTSDGTPE